jgi:hypothetical protein
MKKTILALAMVAAAGAANAAPVSVTSVFNMYSQQGLDQAYNQVAAPVNVDATVTGFIDTAAGTWGVSSSTPFYGLNWTASSGALITTAGNYALDTTTGHVSLAAPDITGHNDALIHFSVGAGQVAGIIDFAWGTSSGIRVVDVWNVSGNTYTAVAAPGMENGPFPGFNAAFNLQAVPVPAAVWLLGSGLVGLVGVARRRKAQAST